MGLRHVWAVAATVLAAPALAHEGAHVHPHGAEGWLALVAVAVAVAGAALFWVRR